MNTTGRYYLTYDPRTDHDTHYCEPDIRMSIDSEANLEQICSFFDSFLKAAGYVYDGDIGIVRDRIMPKSNIKNPPVYNFSDYISFDNLTGSSYSEGGDGTTPSVGPMAIGNSPWDINEK